MGACKDVTSPVCLTCTYVSHLHPGSARPGLKELPLIGWGTRPVALRVTDIICGPVWLKFVIEIIALRVIKFSSW